MLSNQKLQEEEAKLEQLQLRKCGYEETVRQLLKSALQLERIRENREAVIRMQEFIEVQQINVKDAQIEVDLKAAKLTEVMQERKVQEKLKEKAFEAFLQEENAKESKEIDELVSFTYGKRQREE